MNDGLPICNTESVSEKYCGLVLAAGMSSRMYPMGRVISKQLMPIYDKPLIYYAISVLMDVGITNILFIVSPEYLSLFRKLLGDGAQWGLKFSFVLQPEPRGIAQAFHLSKEHIKGKSVFMILGDNVIFGDNLTSILRNTISNNEYASIFSYPVDDPSNYGTVELGPLGEPISLVEKPQYSGPGLAVPGLYLYDEQVADLAAGLIPSQRGEYEITDVNYEYMKKGELSVIQLDKTVSWFDAGTYDSMLDTSSAIRSYHQNRNSLVGYPEHVALTNGYINQSQFDRLISEFPECSYKSNLKAIIDS